MLTLAQIQQWQLMLIYVPALAIFALWIYVRTKNPEAPVQIAEIFTHVLTLVVFTSIPLIFWVADKKHFLGPVVFALGAYLGSCHIQNVGARKFIQTVLLLTLLLLLMAGAAHGKWRMP